MCNDDLIKRKASEFNNSNSLAGPTVKIEPVRKSQRQATKQISKEPIWLQKTPVKEDIPKKVVAEQAELKPMVIDEGEVNQGKNTFKLHHGQMDLIKK